MSAGSSQGLRSSQQSAAQTQINLSEYKEAQKLHFNQHEKTKNTQKNTPGHINQCFTVNYQQVIHCSETEK